ncbi:4,5-DOPA dioxygenase extradiol [bioreactor metagenome]|uniref:4,5-DOPA dioxygenase extradiol n=1 Tax=bioreactor metagenome TaxID=1076179 RepID=A0A645E7T2_9ZZZZ|nr:4,5-DOPA dioxygenase extradiol [Erysipelotrichaceae bacterium]
MSKMPIIFIGHGSPMNAIENNRFTEKWEAMGQVLPTPKAILAVSAHWYTNGLKIMDNEHPKMIYDMYGFPDELYQLVYSAQGSPHFARRVKECLSLPAVMDQSWGYDHGAWSVLRRMFPHADIPVFQVSVNRIASPKEHFRLGQELAVLRQEGVLIFGSGNVVHNLGRVDWSVSAGLPWADEFDEYVKANIVTRNYDRVIAYEKAGPSAQLAFGSLDHFAPLLTVLGAAERTDQIVVFNEERIMGSLSMTSYLFQ